VAVVGVAIGLAVAGRLDRWNERRDDEAPPGAGGDAGANGDDAADDVAGGEGVD
jgi:hypothetical protein